MRTNCNKGHNLLYIYIQTYQRPINNKAKRNNWHHACDKMTEDTFLIPLTAAATRQSSLYIISVAFSTKLRTVLLALYKIKKNEEWRTS